MSPRSNFARVILCPSVLYCGPETGLYLNKGIVGLVLRSRNMMARPIEKDSRASMGEGRLAPRDAPALQASPAVSVAHSVSLAPASSGGPQTLLGSQNLVVETKRPGC